LFFGFVISQDKLSRFSLDEGATWSPQPSEYGGKKKNPALLVTLPSELLEMVAV
jgi:hypothetical protein